MPYSKKSKSTPSSSTDNNGIKIGRFGRRTWDKEFYQKKMESNRKRKRDDQELLEHEEAPHDVLVSEGGLVAGIAKKEGFSEGLSTSEASVGAAQPTKKRKILTVGRALEARSGSISSAISTGRRRVQKKEEPIDANLAGFLPPDNDDDSKKQLVRRSQFYCELCRREFKDNHSLVDHYNSEQHVYNSGMTMRAKKASTSDVMQKLAEARAAASTGGKLKKGATSASTAIVSQVGEALKSQRQKIEDRILEKQKELKRKEQLRAEKEKRKGSIKNVSLHRSKQEKQLEKLLGFQSFGKGK